jgi:hypothetical protein
LATSSLRLTISFFFQLNTIFHSPYVTSSLTKWWVCRLQLLLVLASAVILSPSPAGLMTTFFFLRFETPPPWRSYRANTSSSIVIFTARFIATEIIRLLAAYSFLRIIIGFI